MKEIDKERNLQRKQSGSTDEQLKPLRLSDDHSNNVDNYVFRTRTGVLPPYMQDALRSGEFSYLLNEDNSNNQSRHAEMPHNPRYHPQLPRQSRAHHNHPVNTVRTVRRPHDVEFRDSFNGRMDLNLMLNQTCIRSQDSLEVEIVQEIKTTLTLKPKRGGRVSAIYEERNVYHGSF